MAVVPSSSRQQRLVRHAVLTVGVAGFCAVTLVPDGATGVIVPAARVPAENIDGQINDANGDLENASAVVKKLSEEIAAVQAQLDAAQAKFDSATSSAKQAGFAATSAEATLATAAASIGATDAAVAALTVKIDGLRARIALLARTIYMSGGRVEELQILLESQDPAAIVERLATLKRVSRDNTRVLDQFAAAQTELASKLNELRRLRDTAQASAADAQMALDQATTAQRDAQVAKAEIATVVAKRSALLATAATHRGEVKKMYEQLLAEQRHIAAAAAAAAAAEAAAEAAAAADAAKHPAKLPAKPLTRPSASKPPTAPIPTAHPKPTATPRPTTPGGTTAGASLLWPIAGVSAGGRTGWRIHPVYGYRSCHTGDDIGAPSGTPIRAAASGTVVSTDSGGAYGNNTLISHGGGLATMYAHQSRFAVRPGQRVTQGQIIGYVGSTGWSTGPHLHFEVHVNGIPYEPMGWFGDSRHPVVCWAG